MSHPFITLGVMENASEEKIRAAYLNKIRKYPPESAPVQFQEINQAYTAVKDNLKRAELRLFGQLYDKDTLASILPSNYVKRSHVGVSNWISFLKETHHER